MAIFLTALLTLGATISDEPFNAIPNDGKDDTAAIQAAIDALPEGGHVVIPPGTFNVSTARGITIKQPHLKLIVRGDLVVTTEGKESQDCTNLFTITGPYCRIVGEGGMVRGEGKPFVGAKCPTVHRTMHTPRFFYAVTTAHHCVIERLHMRDPPGGFAAFLGVKNCRLSHCTIEGGVPKDIKPPPPGPYSRYIGVTIISTTGMMIQGNHFNYYQGRGMFSWIGASGSGRHPGTSIVGNVFEGGYDHAIYCSGLVKSVVANNTIRDSVGTAIKLIGDDLTVIGNNIYNCRYGGISTRNGSRNVIAHNTIHGFAHRAIGITPYGGGNRAAYTDNIVQGNILIGLTGKDAPPVMSAIRIESHDHVSRCKVADNIIHNTGTGNSALDDKLPGEPAIYVAGAKTSHHVAITGNVIHNASAGGIVVRNLHDSRIDNNAISAAAEPITRINCRGIRAQGNQTTRPAARHAP